MRGLCPTRRSCRHPRLGLDSCLVHIMEFDSLVKQRRSLRSFAPVEVSDAVIRGLAAAASRAPSCSNKQPWRFAFVRSPSALDRMVGALAPGNAIWGKQASMIIAVWSHADLDCRT